MDAFEAVAIVFSVLVVLTCVFPVIPALAAIILM